MRAVVIREPGGPEVLRVAEVPDPEAGAGEVLIDVAAAAVNRADLLQRQGFYNPPPGASPYPGLEVSGRIAALGAGVTGHKVGDEVCALLGGGGYAERVAVPAGQVLRVPSGVGLVEAAALPEVACTVWNNVFMIGRLRAGERLLVHGGGSGIGTMAIQLGRVLGAHVTCTVGGTAKAGRCRALGADEVVDYTTADFVESGPYDVILDIIGARYLERNVNALAVEGRLTIIGMQGGVKAELNLGVLMAKRAAIHATTLRARPLEEKAEIVDAVAEHVWPLVEAGEVRPIVDQVLPLAEAGKAHEVMAESGHFGKIVLTALA